MLQMTCPGSTQNRMEVPYMFSAKFCSQCGEKIEPHRPTSFAFTAFCSACKRQARFTRFLPVAIVISLTAGGFLIGRLTTPRQQFHFIGAPIDLQNAPDSPTSEPAEASAKLKEANIIGQTASSADEALTMCGSPTKAGRPCRRKVRGGGTCYQHKGKFKGAPQPPQ
jgi:hypothetical protein